MPTIIQYDTLVPGSAGIGFNGSNGLFIPFVASSGGVLVDLRISPAAGYTGNILLGFYANSGSAPGARLAETSVVSMPAGAGVIIIPVVGGPTVVSGTTYWFAMNNDTSNATFNTGTPGGTIDAYQIIGSLSLPSTASVGGTSNYGIWMAGNVGTPVDGGASAGNFFFGAD